MSMANKITASMTEMLVMSVLAVAFIPIVILQFVNISTISGNPLASLFASGGVLIILLFVGLFIALLRRTKLSK